MWLRDFARGLSARPMFRPDSVACRDRFFHHLPTSLRQWPYAAPGQIPQAFIYVAAIKKNDTFARVRVVKSPAGIFLDQLKERLPPGSTGVIKDFFAKLFEFFDANDSDRFGDGFAPLVINSFSVLEFFKWHRTPLFAGFP